jgi:hypothetical protein
MKMLPHEVHPASRSFRTALFIVACVTAASACGGADFEVAGLDGGPDGNMELDAHKKDGRVEETGAHDAGRKDTGAKDSGGHADGTSGLDASLDAPDDVGPNQDGVAPGDAAGDAPHDAIVTNDGPKACPGAAMSCTTSSSMCPLSNFPECAPSTCDQGCCKTTVAQAGTACTEMGGSVCNGMGACVGCVSAAQCPPSTTKCVVPVCTSGEVCATTSAALDTTCNDHGGKLCNGMGQCVVCTSDNASACTGTTLYCGSKGTCVACLTNAQCGALAPNCSNGTCEL